MRHLFIPALPTLALAASLLAACDTGTGAYAKAPDQPFDSVDVPPAASSAGPSQPVAVALPSAIRTPGLDPRLFRDPRVSTWRPRATALVVVEIQQLENLLRATDLQSRDRPSILRRLAEDYHELESAVSTGTGTSPAATARKAMAGAIRNYTLLVTDYSGQPSPEFPTSPPPAYPLLDEVDYYLGYEWERSGDATSARRAYYDLIAKMPSSKYVPSAYLAFGEMFFDEAPSDPTKWEVAKQAYLKTVAYPPPFNRGYGYAWYKLGHAFASLGEMPQALDAFKKTIDFATQFDQVPGSEALAQAARDDVISAYALAGQPNAAYEFFVNLSGDAPGSHEQTFGMMDALGVAYFRQEHLREAAVVYEDLDARDAGGDRACYESRVAKAKSGDAGPVVSPCRGR